LLMEERVLGVDGGAGYAVDNGGMLDV
jgi:hypothetical protein